MLCISIIGLTCRLHLGICHSPICVHQMDLTNMLMCSEFFQSEDSILFSEMLARFFFFKLHV